MTLAARLHAALVSRRLPWLAAALATLFGLPTLGQGLAVDDWLMRLKTRGYGPAHGFSPFDLFSFLHGDVAEVRHWASLGLIPWFASPALKFRFLRPLTSISHWLDYTLFDAWPWVMHAENVALFVASSALAALVYRRLLGASLAAGLATLLFVVDDAHGIALGWISNRNSMLAMFFALGAILSHDRLRRDGWRAGVVVAPLCLAAALASAELGLGAAGYLVAYALAYEDGPLRARLASLAPFALVLALWSAAYVASGCGASQSGLYADPMREPWLLASLLPERLAELLLGALGFPPADVWIILRNAARPLLAPIALSFFAGLAYVALPRLRHDRAARFFALGALLAAFPATAMIPSDRLLMLVGIGSGGLVAEVIVAVLASPAKAPRPGRGARAFAYGLVLVHGVLAPPMLLVTSQLFGVLDRELSSWRGQVDVGPDLGHAMLVVVNAPISLVPYAWVVPHSADDVTPARGAILSISTAPVEVTRVDEHTLRVHPRDGFVAELSTHLFRSPRLASRRGDVLAFEGYSATVDEVDAEGLPTRASIRFDAPLDDASMRFITWNGERFARFTPPRVGASEVIPSRLWP